MRLLLFELRLRGPEDRRGKLKKGNELVHRRALQLGGPEILPKIINGVVLVFQRIRRDVTDSLNRVKDNRPPDLIGLMPLFRIRIIEPD